MTMSALQQKIDKAISLHQSGELDKAEALYREVLKKAPKQLDGLHLLGHVHMLRGELESAQKYVKAALKQEPRFLLALHTMALIHEKQGNMDAAVKSLLKALKIHPQFEEARSMLARIYTAIGRHDDAEQLYAGSDAGAVDTKMLFDRANQLFAQGQVDASEGVFKQLLARDPNDLSAAINYGVLLIDTKRYEEAGAIMKDVLSKDDQQFLAWSNLGLVYEHLQQFDEAIKAYQQSIAIKPDYPQSQFNLANVYKAMGREDDAKSLYQRILEAFPDYIPAANALGYIEFQAKHYDEAERYYKMGMQGEPEDAFYACSQYAILLRDRQRFDEAEVIARKSIELKPHLADPHNTLGWVLNDNGKYEEAEQVFREALVKEPDNRNVHSNLLMLLTYSRELDHDALFQAHCEYGRQHKAKHPEQLKPLELERKPYKKLRIGYVSPDFRRHVVRNFIQPIIREHDRSKVEVFCYANVQFPDEISQIIYEASDHWLNCWGMSEVDLANRIREDKIDVLIELAGHSGNNRLDVFAYRPAPVQVSYLGYIATTGVQEIDYRITDPVMNPLDTKELWTEELYRLDRCYKVYEPAPHEPPVNPEVSPAGEVVFGSLHRISKVTNATVALWSTLLKALPKSKILLARHELRYEENRQLMRERFAKHGVGDDQLLMKDTYGYDTHMAIYREIDIGLDPIPLPGGATTSEALWMGVPVLTFQGEAFRERISSTLLHAVGLEELVATTTEEYVEKGVAFANDYHRRLQVRTNLREMFAGGQLGDYKGLACALEDAYLDMWHRWLAKGES